VPTGTTLGQRAHEADAVSLDDEVVEEGAELGQAVIERMLGGKVLDDPAP
jgi:hypothetical protein